MATYSPTGEELLGAVMAFEQMVRGTRRKFTIGRCAAVDFDGLLNRKEYKGATSRHCLFCGSKGKAAWLEKELIAHAQSCYPDRCQNLQLGGGPQSEENDHIVYVVFWPNRG